MGYLTSPRIAWGAGAIEQLSALEVTCALLVVDPGLAKAQRHRRVSEELAKTGARVEPIDSLVPSVESVEAHTESARALRPDWIVALGGGGTIDAAKGLWVRIAGPARPLRELSPLLELGVRRTTRFVAIPTTSGRGGEASWSSRLRAADGVGIEIASRELVPDWALLDPGFPSTMPPELTASSGAAMLANAFEAIASSWSNPFSDALARAAIGNGIIALPKLARHPDDDEARATVHYAATMAGLAVSNAQAGIARALAEALSDLFLLPVRTGLSVLLPYVVEFNFPSARDRYGLLSAELGPGATASRSSLAGRLRTTWNALGLPRTLHDAGVTAESLEERMDELVTHVERSTSFRANPRIPSSKELRDLLSAARTGTAIGF